MSWEALLYITVGLLALTLILDIWFPGVFFFYEGFTVGPGDNQFLTQFMPRRGDVSFGTENDSSFVQDKRHVMGYADVQALSANQDFCRMLMPKGDDGSNMFFACALAGTENLASASYRTKSVKDGFKTSRDDYMRDADADHRTDYCTIIKKSQSIWEPRCYRALTTTFDTRTFVDTEPPEDINEILYFYEGIMFWFRFIDDLKDYAENLKTFSAGGLTINESDVKVLPSQIMTGEKKTTTTLNDRVQVSQGLRFNGSNQFLRLGDSPDLSFGKVISLKTMRAVCMWVYFEEFTNEAHVLDFGNGAGQDNVFIGIIGRGDETMDKGSEIRKSACEMNDLNNVLPDYPSGAQPVDVVTPVQLMLSTRANVEDPPCEEPILPRKLSPLKPLQKDAAKFQEMVGQPTRTATLVYEVWNGKLRMQHMKVSGAFKLRQWTHVCITTATGDGARPALQIWVDGKKAAEDPNGSLPQSSTTSNNYIGKSNWSNDSSQFENKAELFRGKVFDLRGYSQAVNEDKLKKTIQWGKLRLDIK